MKKRILTLLIIQLLILSLTGCFTTPAEKFLPGQPSISPNLQEGTMEVTLYFADALGLEVIPEERQVPKDGFPDKTIVMELLKGPMDEMLQNTWPKDINPISIETIAGIAYVNMPREARYKLSGANGETLAVDSLVKSLTDLPDIKAVQILVEGRKEATLSGKCAIFEPIYRTVKTGHIYFDRNRIELLQKRVDNGEETWRLDPVEVARRDGRSAGFCLNDDFIKIPQEHSGNVLIEAIHDGMAYVVELEQMLGIGEDKIWSVKQVKAMFTPIRPINYQEGERYKFGVITEIDRDKRILTVKGEYQDLLTSEIGPDVSLTDDAVIHIKRIIGKDENGNPEYKEVDAGLDDLIEGYDTVMIITADKQARSVVAKPSK